VNEQVILPKQANKTKQKTNKRELYVSNFFPWARPNLGCKEILVSIIKWLNITKYTMGLGSQNTYVHLTDTFC